MREASEQAAVFVWAKLHEGRYPALRWLHAIPNGGSRNKIEAANLKRQGVKAGVADMFLPCMRSGYGGLYIEMKAGRNKLTTKQCDFLDWADRAGYATAVCYGAEAAIRTLERYLKGEMV